MGSNYEDLKNVKMILDMSGQSTGIKTKEDHRTQELILFGASLEALRDVKEKVERINERLSYMDVKNEKQVQEVKREEKSLLDQIKQLNQQERDALLQILKPQLEESHEEDQFDNINLENSQYAAIESISERKKNMVKVTVQKYGKITSSQLSRVIGLSRTRCNEYLKELELLGQLTAFTEDKKRYYQIKC